MSESYSFIDLPYLESLSEPSVPSLESFEEDSESVFSMARRSPTVSETKTQEHSLFDSTSVDDENSPIRHDKVFCYESLSKGQDLYSVKEEEPEVVIKPEPVESNEDPRPVQELKKRGRKRKTPENVPAIKQEREFSPFPKYYKFTQKELNFFKNIKLVQSSSDITHIKDNIYMIEIVHHDKSVELIRCFRSLTDHKMYFCAVDVFYPIVAIKENVNREVKKRVSPKNYYILHIESKGKSLTFVDLIGFVDIVRYRMNPKSTANQGIRDVIRCNELAIELQKYL